MSRLSRRSHRLAAAATFAALYAALGYVPISRLFLGSGFLTANKIIAPLIGMVLGPVVGVGAVVLGDAFDLYAGLASLATVFADLCVVLTAGLAFAGRRLAAVSVLALLILWYDLDPLAVLFVGPFPFVTLHLFALAALAAGLALEARGRMNRLSPVFVAAVSFGALMAGQLGGTVAGMNILVRLGTTSPEAWKASLSAFVFPAIPLERSFYTLASVLVSVPVLRSLRTRPGGTTGS